MLRVLILYISISSLFAQNLITDYEKSGYKKTPRYAETIEYCKKLANASPFIRYTTFGISPQGRDLPLLIVDKNARYTPTEVRKTDNVVFMIQAGIHSGEIDGKDAGFILLRDIIRNKNFLKLIDHVTILFIPIFNVDGHERFSAYSRANQNGPEEMGWRVTAQNYNLNRDYLKADASEMQAWLKLYNDWLPEFFADCHVTDGADYQYTITYKIDQHGLLDPELIQWVNDAYLPPLKKSMAEENFPLMEYVWFKESHKIESGMLTWAAPPRFSDGYTAIQNRPGLLIETHMFKDYKSRVDATYAILKHTLEILNQQYQILRSKISRADKQTAQPGFRVKPLTLTYKMTDRASYIDFLGYEYSIIKSDITGGDWFRYYTNQPRTFRVPFFNTMEPVIKVQLPDAYIVPAGWSEVIKRIKVHGIKYLTLKDEKELLISTYKFSKPKWNTSPYEGHQTVEFELTPIEIRRTFFPGSIVIDMNQRAAKVIANILEPQAPDSYVYWGFFNTIFERKEYVESYVMEERARMMLAGDEELKREFEIKMKNDKSFAEDPAAILMWFYEKSPYWDEYKDVYPIGRIFKQSD
ncbi:MAG: M14 family metallopeptidase [Calditrichaceae bacterium]|nr:M14 family metallopeptidase [Calditrichaceae bacterium]